MKKTSQERERESPRGQQNSNSPIRTLSSPVPTGLKSLLFFPGGMINFTNVVYLYKLTAMRNILEANWTCTIQEHEEAELIGQKSINDSINQLFYLHSLMNYRLRIRSDSMFKILLWKGTTWRSHQALQKILSLSTHSGKKHRHNHH